MRDAYAEARRRMQKVVNEASEVGAGHSDPFDVQSELPDWSDDGVKSDTLAIGVAGNSGCVGVCFSEWPEDQDESHESTYFLTRHQATFLRDAITRALAREVEK